ncbi:MAG: transglutaminase-like superfamily [Blautia sp.]|nr:transglutaminase-like superfamily [Blautia sp.]
MRKRETIINLVMYLAFICLIMAVLWEKGYLPPGLDSDTSILSAARNVLAREPAEVRRLREQEVVQSEEGHEEFYFRQLNQDEKRAYREMLAGFRAWESDFYLTIAGDEELDRVYHAVLNDHPELFWVRNREPVYKTVYSGQSFCSFSPAYIYGGVDNKEKQDSEEARQIQASMDAAVREIDTLVSADASEYDKAFAVYTYIIDQTEYRESKDDQSIAGVFWKKEAVCAGYAGAVQYLLEHLGVFCIYVEGNTLGKEEGHAWNIVRIDGEYYYVDATNGDQPEFLFGDFASLPWHKTIMMDYLCPFPLEYETTYSPSPLFPVPLCSSTACNFYVLNNGSFDYYDPYSLDDYFKMRIGFGAAVIRFKFTNREAYDAACAYWLDSDQLDDAVQYYMNYNGLGQVEYHYGSLDTLMTMYFIF